MNLAPTSDPTHRLTRLDMLRGLAALAVVLFHYTVKFAEFFPAAPEAPVRVPLGFYGVHLFFVISGYVILLSLDRTGGRGFVRSRFIRLFPVYWAAVLLTSAAMALDPAMGAAPGWGRLLANLTMAEQYLRIAPVDGAYWSLTYELGFYALLYAVVRWLPAAVRWLPLWLVGGAAIYPVAASFIPAPLHLLIGVHPYAHLFGAGIALYLLRHGRRGWSFFVPLMAAPVIQSAADGAVGGLIVALIVLLVWWASAPAAPASRAARPLVWLGSISYALYVTHQTIGYLLIARLEAAGMPAAAALPLTLALALMLGWALTAWVERPSALWLRAHLPRGLRWPRARPPLPAG